MMLSMKNSKGYTLIELLVAIVAGTIFLMFVALMVTLIIVLIGII